MNQNDIVNDSAFPSNPSSPQANCNSAGIGCPYDNQPRSIGEYLDTFELDDLQSGNYTLRFYTEHEYRVQQITVNTF